MLFRRFPHIGLTEDECKEKNIAYLVGRSYYEENARGQIIGDMSGMIKLIFSPTDKKLWVRISSVSKRPS